MAIVSTVMPLLRPLSQGFNLRSRSEISRSAYGTSYVKNMGSAIWVAEWSTRSLRHDDAIDLEAVIHELDDGMNQFYAYDVRRPHPKLYPTNVALNGLISSFSGGTTMALKSLPIGMQLSRGDYLAFDYTDPSGATSRALHQITSAGALVGGLGLTGNFTVRPHYRDGIAIDLEVNLFKPSGVFIPDIEGFKGATDDVLRSSATLTATQQI